MATNELQDVEAFVGGRKLTLFNWQIITLSALITGFEGIDIGMVAYAGPYLRDDLALTSTMLGNVFAAAAVGMALGGPIIASLGDRCGRRPTLIATAWAMGFLTLLTATAETYSGLLLLRLLAGIAMGGLLPITWALNIEFAPRRHRSTVIAIVMIGYSLGIAIAAPLTNFVAPRFGWHGIYVIGGVGTCFAGLLLVFSLPESLQYLVSHHAPPARINKLLRQLGADFVVRTPGNLRVLATPSGGPGALRNLFADRLGVVTPLLWLACFVSSLAIFFSLSWSPILLEGLGVPRQTASLLASAGMLVGSFLGIGLTQINDRFGLSVVSLVCAVLVPILLGLGLGLFPPRYFLPVIVIQSALIGAEQMVIVAIAGIFYSSDIRARGAGWVSAMGKIGGVVGPVIGGYVLASGAPVLRTYTLLAMCPAVMFACLLGIAVMVRRTILREAEQMNGPFH